MSIEPLTGSTRWRVYRSWLGPVKVVLQVQERWVRPHDSGRGGVESSTYLVWRDARPEDVTVTIKEPG